MFLRPIWRQLSLPGMEVPGLPLLPLWAAEESEHRHRTAAQWLQSAIRYCDWRADSFRGGGRWNPNRIHYLNGRALLADLLCGRSFARELQLVLPSPLQPSILSNPIGGEFFAGRSRASLADELIAADPCYSDRQLLSRLPRKKLAAMLAASTSAQPERKRA